MNAIAAWFMGFGMVLAGPGPDDLDTRVRAALERARPVLLEHLQRSHGGQLALLCLAALHDEVPKDHPVLAGGLARLLEARLDGTYDHALRLMVMAEWSECPGRERRAREDLAELFARQVGGGFSYTNENPFWDLSNTQYGALGMRAAASLGVRVDPERWQRLLRAVRAEQNQDGGFDYSRGRHGSYASMTVAGIGVLEICRHHLGAQKVPERLQREIDAAWAWMDRQAASIGDPQALHCFYFHYGLERAAILSGRKEVGGVGWYRRGAEMLLDLQAGGGGWSSGFGGRRGPNGPERGKGSPIDTAFAVLFLRRKFQAQAAPLTPGRATPVQGLAAQADERALEAAIAHDVARGLAAFPELLECLRSPVVLRRKAAALAIARISRRDFGYVPYIDPAQQEGAIRAAEAWWRAQAGGR